MLDLSLKQINELCGYLRGTCNSLDAALGTIVGIDSSSELTPASFEAIDKNIFKCATCDWFCDVDELNSMYDGQVCNDCC